MKSLFIFASLMVVVLGAPANDDTAAAVVKQESENIGVDVYKFSYQTSNGIAAQEEGVLQNVGSENEAIQVRGTFSYTGPDGNVYQITYIADENGFRPEGAHISKTP